MSTNATAGLTGTSNRTVYFGLWALAAVGFAALVLVGQGLAAAAVFVLAGGAATVYRATAGVPFDERDATVMGVASARAVQAFGIASGIVFPALTVATALEYVEWTPFLSGAGTVVAAFFVVWAGTVLAVKRRW